MGQCEASLEWTVHELPSQTFNTQNPATYISWKIDSTSIDTNLMIHPIGPCCRNLETCCIQPNPWQKIIEQKLRNPNVSRSACITCRCEAIPMKTWIVYMSCGRNYVHGELAMSKLGAPLSVVKVLNFLSFHYLKWSRFRRLFHCDGVLLSCQPWALGCLLTVCFLQLVLVLLCGLVLSTQALAWVFPAGAGIVCVCLLALPLCSCCTCPSKGVKQVKHSTIHG